MLSLREFKMVKKERKHIVKSLVEIALLITMTFAISYEIYQADKNIIIGEREKENYLLNFAFNVYRGFVKMIISDKNMVSALNSNDLQQGAYTCVLTKLNQSCQEFPASECNEKCNGACVPATRSQVSQCLIGTCYDSREGTCQPGSPKGTCESGGGNWFDDPNANIPQCQRGCCLIGDQATFATSQECTRKAAVLGMEKTFKSEIRNEIGCLVLAKTQEEGACVFESDFETTCKFTTKTNCIQLTGKSSGFYSGLLCSNPELKTNCKPQIKAACSEGKDEIYWYDSCGNRENIYDANKVKSFNAGKILAKNETCSLSTGNNPLGNKNTCGNCNYLLGSICGIKTSNEKLADSSQNYVCRDLSCKDDLGNKRLNGESWCAYQGAIGVDGTGKTARSVDTPGSRHFRQVCIDGEVRTEPCGDYRNEICVEAQSPIANGNTFSSAACRINRWQQCLEYNTQPGTNTKKGQENRDDKCSKNPDCFVKSVSIDKNFKFNICAPKYPAGFDLKDNGEAGEQICSLASQKCTVVYVKKVSGWKCVANCNCEKAGFTQQMNDLCLSLGDCGAKANYIGELGTGYKVKGAPKLSSSYFSDLKDYAEPVEGSYAEPGNISEFYGDLGFPEGLGQADKNAGADPNTAAYNFAMARGAIGVGVAWLAGTVPGASILSSLGLATTTYTVGGATGTVYSAALAQTIATETGGAIVANPGLSAAGGAFVGAAIGGAVVSLLIKFLGIGPGLDPAMTFSLVIAGSIAGAIIGAQLFGATAASPGLLGTLGGAGPAGLIILAVVVVIIVVMKLLGIGKTKKKIVQFTCQPWQPQNGGSKCDLCGSDTGNSFGGKALPCSKYSCQSLGQTCEFINEGTGQETCVDISPNDAAAPILKPLQSVLSSGYSYTEVGDSGFRIVSNVEDGCIKAYSPLLLGIELNEPGQCRMDTEHTNRFEDMEFDFGGRSLYVKNHTMLFSYPNVESLIPGYDPNRRADQSVYVRCQDKNGNKNIAEYTLNFCLRPGEDLTAPLVTAREPYNEYVSWNTTSLDANIFVNEPADCKWDIADKDYDLMNNSLNCINGVEDQELLGWKCSTTFPISKNDSTFFIRCKDQPWLIESINGENAQIVLQESLPPSVSSTSITGNVVSEDVDNINEIELSEDDLAGIVQTANQVVDVPASRKRNKNSESYQFVVKRSRTQLKIDSINVDNKTMRFGVEPASIPIEVKTSGGLDGKATCRYAIRADEYLPLAGDSFVPPNQNTHRVTFQLFNGNHYLYVKCTDIAGNVADKLAQFKIELDVSPPIVTRAYEQSNALTIITNENSQCYLSTSSCNFDIINGSIMNGAQLVHSISYNKAIPNYIKCVDGYGNTPGSCSITIKGGS